MTESELKTLIQQSHQKPLRVNMDDGRVFRISHPDFAFIANEWLILSGGDDGLNMLPFEHIAGVHVSRKKSKVAA